MKKAQLASVANYLAARKETISCWAPILAAARGQIETDRPPLQGFIAAQHFLMLADRAVWASTEITPAKSWKYGAQPYISEAVFKRWEDCLACEDLRQPVGALPSKDLRHEHVLERKQLLKLLQEARTAAEVSDVLHRSLSCVVTEDEHAVLSKKGRNASGWDRYRAAGIRVYDRVSRDWLI